MFDVIQRSAAAAVRERAKYYPALSITGPRQAGKTTLARMMFPEYRYIDFENIIHREAFNTDPVGFLEKYDRRVIFDEAQRVPTIFNFLLGVIDADQSPARFILSGSQNFLAVEDITQSLAGRVGIIRLFPLTFAEIPREKLLGWGPRRAILNGYYPRPYTSGLPSELFYADYVTSYLERDVRHLIRPSNMLDFRLFLNRVASLVGQPLNYSTIASELKVSVNTVKQWIHFLTQTYLVFLVAPYTKNAGKRVSKRPKLYFYDTGLAAFLCDLKEADQLDRSNLYGQLFENQIIADIQKQRMHAGNLTQDFCFYRDDKGLEVDYVDRYVSPTRIMEIKASTTPKLAHTISLDKVAQRIDASLEKYVVYGGNETANYGEVDFLPWYDWAKIQGHE